MINWTETFEKSSKAARLPTNIIGDQVKVMLYSPGWACPRYGLYTHTTDGGEWWLYNQQKDRYEDDLPVPEYWAKVNLPMNSK